MCVPYRRIEQEIVDPRVTDARARLEAARDALVDADLRVVCGPADDLWTLTIAGSLALPADGVEVVAWPVSVAEDQASVLPDNLVYVTRQAFSRASRDLWILASVFAPSAFHL